MTRTGPKAELATLRRSVKELDNRFLKPHIGAPTLLHPSRAEVLDVAAFVVLVHGALENFVEGLAFWVLTKAVSNWTTKKRTTRCTVSLLLHQPSPGTDTAPGAVYDIVRHALSEAKELRSKAIEGNNGITPRHLKELFYPLGVDVPADPVMTASLDLLVTMRHQWAHQFRHGAKVVKSAADAQVAVADCLKFAAVLATSAVSLKP
jgi:hypothetical protein